MLRTKQDGRVRQKENGIGTEDQVGNLKKEKEGERRRQVGGTIRQEGKGRGGIGIRKVWEDW